MIKTKRVPDISIFCWTEPYRLYHPDLVLSAGVEPVPGQDTNVYKALDQYWMHLQNYDKDELAYEYALKYYDRHILSSVKSQIVQMWSFRPFETVNKNLKIQLETGSFIDESMFSFSTSARNSKGWQTNTINHMTPEQNKQWAEKVFKYIE